VIKTTNAGRLQRNLYRPTVFNYRSFPAVKFHSRNLSIIMTIGRSDETNCLSHGPSGAATRLNSDLMVT